MTVALMDIRGLTKAAGVCAAISMKYARRIADDIFVVLFGDIRARGSDGLCVGKEYEMTREEAISLDAVIEWLKAKDFIKMSWQEENARKELQEYFSVTPAKCEDAISREAFIKRYDEWMYSEYGKHCEKDALAIRVANSLPSVTSSNAENTLESALKTRCEDATKHEYDIFCSHKCDKCVDNECPLRECEDAISREAVMGLVARGEWDDMYIDIAKLPPVTPKPTECEDCVSREAVTRLFGRDPFLSSNEAWYLRKINELPSVTPSHKVIEDIKAEIKAEMQDHEGQDDFTMGVRYGLRYANTIIDKHIGGAE